MPDRQPAAERAPEVRDIGLADGRVIRVRDWPGSGRPLVLLHGLLDSSEGWSEFARSAHGRCVAIDLPGFGGSSRVSRARLRAYADDVVEALDHLGVGGAVLVGHSLGGAVAAAVADLIPDRIESLGLLAPAGFGRIHLAELVSIPGFRQGVAAVLPLALGSRAAVTAAYATMVTAGRLPAAGVIDRVTKCAREMVPGARDATEAIVEAGTADDAMHKRRLGYHGPASVLWGRHDRLVPIAHLKGLRRALPQIEADVGAFGHHPHRECCERLEAFMDRVLAAPSPVAHLSGAADKRRRRHAIPVPAPVLAAASGGLGTR